MDTNCILWKGKRNRWGYGTTGSGLAHRVEWAKVNGPIPKGLTLDHVCHDPKVCQLGNDCPHRRCVNLDHLELVTPAENRARSGAGQWQLAKTHCPQGHPYSGDNLLVYDGHRLCRTCRRAKQAAIRAQQKLERCRELGHERIKRTAVDGKVYCVVCATKTTAPSINERKVQACLDGGHERQPATGADGREYCTICALRTGEAAGEASKRRAQQRTHCPKGHPYAGDNLIINTRGARVCRACRVENNRAYKAASKKRPALSVP